MKNPYKVLGVNEGATPEEIRAAYLQLVKRYHPDKYTDPEMKRIANERLVEINEAYETLTKRGGGNSASAGRYYSGYGYSGQGGAYSGPEAEAFARARAYINQNNIAAARAVLDSISVRNAEWYYLYGIVYLREGWHDKAFEYFNIAYNQEPGNSEYANAFYTLRHTGNPYQRPSGGYGDYNAGCSACDVCAGLMCADCCCNCAGCHPSRRC